MFEKLIESEADQTTKSRRSYFLTSSIVVGILFITAVVLSIYADDYGLGKFDIELAELSTPIEVTTPEPEPQPQTAPERSSTSNEPTMRTANVVQRIEDNTTIPTGVATAPSAAPTAPRGSFQIGPINRDSGPAEVGRTIGETVASNESSSKEVRKIEPESIPDQPPPIKTPKTIKVSRILNGEAKSLPKPIYSAMARQAGAEGLVKVQVTIDESGRVVSAKAVDGNPLLRRSAEDAARSARFSATILNDQAVKVTGVIAYNFIR